MPTAIGFEWSWLSPISIESFSALAAGLSLSIFIYWDWDAGLSASEETSDSDKLCVDSLDPEYGGGGSIFGWAACS